MKNQNGDFQLIKEEGIWKYAEDTDFPLDEEIWQEKLSVLRNITVVRTLKEPEELEEYGLSTPVAEIVFSEENGEEIQMFMGDQNAVTGDYYFYTGDSTQIYTVSSTVAAVMECDLYDLAEESIFPEISSDTLKNMTISKKQMY